MPWRTDDEGRRVPVKRRASQMRLSGLIRDLERLKEHLGCDPVMAFLDRDDVIRPLFFMNGQKMGGGAVDVWWLLRPDCDPIYEDDSPGEGEDDTETEVDPDPPVLMTVPVVSGEEAVIDLMNALRKALGRLDEDSGEGL